MKLIIDIYENLYKATINGLDANEIWDLRLAVKNGTPLDDIKAEIDELDFDFGDFYDHTEEIHEMIDKVWNKHTEKEQSE